MTKKYNLIIIGSGGQLGSEFLASSDEMRQYFDFKFLSKKEFDITNFEQIDQYLDNKTLNIIVNCSAYTNVDLAEAEREKAFNVNGYAIEGLIKRLKSKGAILIHISTDYVFSGENKNAYLESDLPDPKTSYGLSKYHGEKAIMKMKPLAIIIRTSWLYSVSGNNFLNTILKKIDNNEEIAVVDDQFGSPTYTKDLTAAIFKLILSERFEQATKHQEIFHYSNIGYTSWYGFAIEILNNKQIDPKIIKAVKSNHFKMLANRPKFSILNTNKIRNHFNLEIPTWQNSLAECMRK